MALSATPLATATLKDADRYFRLADFQKAYSVSSRVVFSDEFATWKAKQRHDAAKAFIRHAHHHNKCVVLRRPFMQARLPGNAAKCVVAVNVRHLHATSVPCQAADEASVTSADHSIVRIQARRCH